MRAKRESFWGIVLVYGVVAFLWLVAGDWFLSRFLAGTALARMDLVKDLTFLVGSIALLAWLLITYSASCREFSVTYEGVFEAANDAFLVFDDTGTIVDANRKACIMYGYPLEQLTGLHGRDIVHPDSYGHFEGFLAASALDLDRTIESLDIRADGTSFPVEVRGAIIPFNGTPHRLAIVRDISYRAEFERVTGEAEARWMHAMDFVDDAICLLDLDDRILQANRAFYALSGLSPQQAVGQEIAIIHPPGETSPCPLCAARKARRDAVLSLPVAHPYNRFGRPVEITLKVIRDGRGEAVSVLMGFRDLSKIEELREQLALLSLSAEIGVVLTSGGQLHEMLRRCVELLVERLDGAFARIWTLDSRQELLRLQASAGMYTHLDGPHSRIPLVEEYKIAAIALHKGAILTNQVLGDRQIRDQEWARKEGIVAFAGHPLLVGERVIGVLGIFAKHPFSPVVSRVLASIADELALGIDRVHSEAELLQKNRALRTLSECNEILVRAENESRFLAEICGVIVGTGGYRMAWVGLKDEDPEQSVRVVASAGDSTGYLNTIRVSWADNELGQGPTGRAIRHGEVVICQDTDLDANFSPWREKARNGGLGSSLAVPLRHSGEVLGALNIYAREAGGFGEGEVALLQELAADVAYGIRVLRDRAEARKMAEEGRRLERQVRQSQKMEAIGTLAGGIAHDFNNTLAAILGFTDLAKYKLPENSELRRDLDNVLEAGMRAKELVKQILTFSRQAEQERRPVELYLIVKEAMKLLRASIPKNIDFSLAIDEQSGSVVADPTQMHQVVMNLCTNAYHAMRNDEAGELAVSLAAVELDQGQAAQLHIAPGAYLRLAVRDSGCGMTPEIQERIFEPYYTTKPRGEGTGMGLAVVHGIVSQCDGAIRVASELGRGTTIEVYLPKAQGGATEMERIIAHQLPGGKERILVVDDEPVVLAMHEAMLERLGYQVTPMASSHEALAEFASRPQEFDLLFTDMSMPGMTGDLLVQKVKAIRPEIPVIMCTGFSEKLTPERAHAIGIGKMLMKPLLLRELATSIREFLDT